MYEKNHSLIGQAMNFTFRPLLAAFVAQNLARHFAGKNWWQWGVLDVLYENQKRNLPHDGTDIELTDRLDVQICLTLIDVHWEKIFSKKMPRLALSWIKELKNVRNTWAHEPETFDDATTIRALDTMALISESFDDEVADDLRTMKNKILQSKKNFAAVVEQVQELLPIPENLKAWRDVIEPHPDVAQGRYRQAEFALNLADIFKNKESRAEYADPVEFFARTYLTDGLKNLLVETLKRLSDGNGEPIIQLKTSFGGGKSHSLLALYHLFGGKIRSEQSKAVREVLNASGVDFLPKVHTAVIVGTWENPLRSTLWGELATQLARSTGKPELYELIRENDERGVSPGVELLQKLFNEAGACLVLIDELVAYGRKLSLGEIESGGSFGNLISFIQELTEAAKGSPKTSVVVSIPESDAEIVDELGHRVLKQVEKIFGRMEFVWTPVSVVEGYEIVRRRLFKECIDLQARENICAAFANMYANNPNDFPYESKQSNYREKLLSCYPIHPKLFDYLYDKWTSLENFQKTRGVLRLMARVIYQLWTSNDKSLMIMPSSIPLESSSVRDELTKLLGGNWDAIVNAEVDGEHSKPHELDTQNPRFGRLVASRKISRTIFMGTAPGSRKGDVRGVDESEIRLSTIQPHEVESIATYNDALTKLKANLYYLYSQGTRLWFGVNPTLRKLVDDKRGQFSDDDINWEIEKRLQTWRKRGKFKAVYICPKTSADVPDEKTARLVILSPENIFDDRQKNNAAIDTAKKFLDTRGNALRMCKNTLMFLAADAENFSVLKDTVRDYLAWQAVNSDARALNLDSLQLVDAKNNLKTATENFAMKVSQTYCKLIAPETYGATELNIPLKVTDITCTKEDNIFAASEKFSSESMLVDVLGPDELLRRLNKFIWHDSDNVNLNQLWEYFATYYYMPRLLDVNVLLEAVRKGIAAKTFGLAKKSDDGKFSDVQYGAASVGEISLSSFIIKAPLAEELLNIKKEPPPPPETVTPVTLEPVTLPADSPPPKYFSMDAELDKSRLAKSFNSYIGEVVSPMMNLPNVEVSIRLVVDITVPDGVPKLIKENVEANCQQLKVKNFHFES